MGQTHLGIWIIDAEGKSVYVNPRMAEIVGANLYDMVGKPLLNFVFPEDVEGVQPLFTGKKRGDLAPFHFRLRRREGSAVWVNVVVTPMHSAAGDFKGIVGTFSVSS